MPILVVKALNTSKLIKKRINVKTKSGKVIQQERWVLPDQGTSGPRGKKQPPIPAVPIHGVPSKPPMGAKKKSKPSTFKEVVGSDPSGQQGQQDAKAPATPSLQAPKKSREERLAFLADKGSVKKIPKEKLVQPTGDLDEIYKLAQEAREGFKNSVHEAAKMFGAVKVMSRETLKDKKRVFEKMKEDKATDAKQIYDFDGHTLIFNDLGKMAEAVEYFINDPRVLRLKNNFATPTDVGYRDINMNIQLPNGTISELQLSTTAMMTAKMEVGHVFYEVWREAIGQCPPPPPPPPAAEMAKAQESLYNFAWEESQKTEGYKDEASVRASCFDIVWPYVARSAKVIEEDSPWLSEKTRKHFQELGSKANGTSSRS